ncbi:META domain-containing protein [Thermoflexus sp.]|jgi:heat shock protein HslJ|uniref:META domain-containing protein n=1 Tax=Thermoflexus sp. TaxID=1969742 RepID=UPI003C0A7C3A
MGTGRIAAAGMLGLLVLALTACGGGGRSRPDPLHGTSWNLISLEGTAPLPGTRITVTFDAGVIQGSSGCNRFSGAYEISGDRIAIHDVRSTLMACIKPEGVMDQEQKFLALLMSSEGYQIMDGRLQLTRSGQVLLTFMAEN